MHGAIIGDIVGSIYEFKGLKNKDFQPLFHPEGGITDDTVMTVAIADSLLNNIPPAEAMRTWHWRVMIPPSVGGYGVRFIQWLLAEEIQPPYGSYGNGAAMRVSPVGWLYDDIPKALEMAKYVTEVSHNHPEGIKGAQAVVLAMMLARENASPDSIRQAVAETFGYDMDRDVDFCRATLSYSESCQKSVPESIICALEAESYEEAIRNAVSMGGDADTMAAIAGGIAEVMFGIPESILKAARPYYDLEIVSVIEQFYDRLAFMKSRSNP